MENKKSGNNPRSSRNSQSKSYSRPKGSAKGKYRGQSRTKPYQKGRDYEEKGSSQDDALNASAYVGGSNDPTWYNKNTRLIADVSKISFSNQLGANFNCNTSGGTRQAHNSGTIPEMTVPGIAAIKMVNIPGIARTATDGVNLAASGLFQYIRKNLSTVASYGAADVMMYVLGIDEIYSMYSNIARVFGIINAYSAINLYMPQALLEAAYGFNTAEYANISQHLNDYRAEFNNLIFKASTLYLPTDFTITKRHAWLYSNYFVDGQSSKAQIYIHRMVRHYLIREDLYDTGTCLYSVENATTLQGLLDDFNDCIEKYRNSDSMLKIAADMRRAFEGRVAWKLAYIDEAYMVLPMYDMNVLNQIHNLMIYPNAAFFDIARKSATATQYSLNVTQDVNKNIIIFDPRFRYKPSFKEEAMDAIREFVPLISDTILNFHKPDVTSDDILEATRNCLAADFNSPDADTDEYLLKSTGVDMCVGVSIYQKSTNGQLMVNSLLGSVLPLGAFIYKQLSAISAFDWLPKLWVPDGPYVENESRPLLPFTDFENYTVVSRDLIGKMNDNILTSMWNVPEFGAYTM